MSEWLELPIGLIQVFAESMPGLLAEENLTNSSVAAVGSGMAKNANAVRARWERLAREIDRAEVEPESQMTRNQFKVVAASMGLGLDA